MKECIFEIRTNELVAKATYKMVLVGDTSDITRPGQFVNIKLENFYLRRPISVCDVNGSELTIIYKVVGEGTEVMSKMENGQLLNLLVGLGNGYDTSKSGSSPLLLGGGVGVPPLFMLCKELLSQGKKPTVILGFNSADEIILADDFKALGAEVVVATADGSFGVKGFVTHAMEGVSYDYFFTCGPMPMFKAIEAVATTSGQFSFEERMGCGFGACMGCSCKTKYGNKRICRDGPVLEREEIIW